MRCSASEFVNDSVPQPVSIFLQPLQQTGDSSSSVAVGNQCHKGDWGTLQTVKLPEMLEHCLDLLNVLEINATNFPANQAFWQLMILKFSQSLTFVSTGSLRIAN